MNTSSCGPTALPLISRRDSPPCRRMNLRMPPANIGAAPPPGSAALPPASARLRTVMLPPSAAADLAEGWRESTWRTGLGAGSGSDSGQPASLRLLRRGEQPSNTSSALAPFASRGSGLCEASSSVSAGRPRNGISESRPQPAARTERSAAETAAMLLSAKSTPPGAAPPPPPSSPDSPSPPPALRGKSSESRAYSGRCWNERCSEARLGHVRRPATSPIALCCTESTFNIGGASKPSASDAIKLSSACSSVSCGSELNPARDERRFSRM
mmetsp:Transcript_42990/g.106030  ORF Transcript_42990/g.106030 Transcript_42990/m.106030 type:complete len:270 (-) Transcript_42990:485-1294(-)